MDNPESGRSIDLNASAQSAADRLVDQVRAIETQWSSLADRSKWSDGEELLSNVHTSAEALARQIKLSFDADHS